ncbi:hypothetical protein BD413DRAFT_610257 [Trametes elegans]|nr:hypothetical protein BD413DRAFT_610257 [Trametes elegans]
MIFTTVLASCLFALLGVFQHVWTDTLTTLARFPTLAPVTSFLELAGPVVRLTLDAVPSLGVDSSIGRLPLHGAPGYGFTNFALLIPGLPVDLDTTVPAVDTSLLVHAVDTPLIVRTTNTSLVVHKHQEWEPESWHRLILDISVYVIVFAAIYALSSHIVDVVWARLQTEDTKRPSRCVYILTTAVRIRPIFIPTLPTSPMLAFTDRDHALERPIVFGIPRYSACLGDNKDSDDKFACANPLPVHGLNPRASPGRRPHRSLLNRFTLGRGPLLRIAVDDCEDIPRPSPEPGIEDKESADRENTIRSTLNIRRSGARSTYRPRPRPRQSHHGLALDVPLLPATPGHPDSPLCIGRYDAVSTTRSPGTPTPMRTYERPHPTTPPRTPQCLQPLNIYLGNYDRDPISTTPPLPPPRLASPPRWRACRSRTERMIERNFTRYQDTATDSDFFFGAVREGPHALGRPKDEADDCEFIRHALNVPTDEGARVPVEGWYPWVEPAYRPPYHELDGWFLPKTEDHHDPFLDRRHGPG